ncbi:MAG: AbrB/MazE/SpoVT family DNA-binding domain-containing protein [Thermomicrobiales bacterium]
MARLEPDGQKLVRVQDKGQVTLPADVRRRTGLKKGDLVSVTATPDGVLIKPVEVRETKGSPWLKELYDYFAPVRAEAIEKGYTEEDINAAIDGAVRDVRVRAR